MIVTVLGGGAVHGGGLWGLVPLPSDRAHAGRQPDGGNVFRGIRHTRLKHIRLIPGIAIALTLVGCVLVLSPLVASAAIQTVTNCNDSGAGSLRQAVADAESGDTIEFALAGSCSTITLTTGDIEITTNLTIEGPGASLMAVSGNNDNGNNDVSNIFVVNSAISVGISGLTIENGIADNGGGIANSGTLSISNSTFSDNRSSVNAVGGGGGAIYNNAGSISVTGSTFDSNRAHGNYTALGGAINNYDGILSVSGSSFTNNGADEGGAIFTERARNTDTSLQVSASTFSENNVDIIRGAIGDGGGVAMDINNSTITDNYADEYGGAIDNGGVPALLTVSSSALTANSAYQGGGIYGGGVVTNSTLSNNFANYGGAMYGGGTVTDSTLSDNGADEGGAIYGGGTVTDSTLSDNTADEGGGIYDAGAVTDSTLSGNSANEGGGIYGGGTLTHDTLTANSAQPGDGGGIDATGSIYTLATIVSSSGSGTDCVGTSTRVIQDGGYNLDDDGSCGFNASTDHSDTDPLLDPSGLQNNGGPTQTIALEPDSPAIGAVTSASVCSTPRPSGLTRPTPCDIGAYEANDLSQNITFTSIAPLDSVIGSPGYRVGDRLLGAASSTNGRLFGL